MLDISNLKWHTEIGGTISWQPRGRAACAFFVSALIALASCDSGEPAIPPEVQRLTEADFPADGNIHVIRSSGRFRIRQDTEFCTFRPGYGLDGTGLAEALEKKGQSAYFDGRTRTNCATDDPDFLERLPALHGTAVFIRVTQSDNRRGEPYKLVLTVWQGDPAKGGGLWAGGVERGTDAYHPRTVVVGGDLGHDSGERDWSNSISLDATDLSESFTADISKQRAGG